MPGQAHDTMSKPVISAIAAQLFVADIKASCDFFTQKLGFSIVFTYGEPPFYAQVKRDRALLNLKCVDYPVIDPALRDRESLLSADMAVDTHEEIWLSIRTKRSSSCSWNFKRQASPSFRR
jgi:Glyoxalase/Bleomycin resistance protein/Dioxygenase superfamily